jgi:LysR family transcriptional regulator, glycine cleavage system transcriptional activator
MLRSKARKLPPLHALRAFEAAARRMSFKEAAAELSVTPTAVSHQIRQLEELLGVRLFERRSRAIALTPQGRDLYPVLRDGFDGFAQAVANLKTRRLRTVLTVSATTAFTARWLLPRAASFRRLNPGMDLRLHASDEPVNLQTGAADAAIRYGLGRYSDLESEPLFQDRFAPVCNPQLAIRHPTDLARHTIIRFEWTRPRRDDPTWQRWLARAGVPHLQPAAELILTDESQAIQAAIAGQGVALVSSLLTEDEIARGTLLRPFELALESYHYHLVYPHGAGGSDKVEALRKWVLAEAARAART